MIEQSPQQPEIVVDKNLVAKSCLPQASPELASTLRAKIEAEGPVEPITVWDDGSRRVVVDGVLRLNIYRELGIEDFPTVSRSFATLDEAVRYRVHHNIVRRQMNAWQRCKAVLPFLAQRHPEGRENQMKGGQGASDLRKADKWAEAAELANVSEGTLSKAKCILDNIFSYCTQTVAEEKLRALDDEKKTISAIFSDIKEFTNKARKGRDGCGRGNLHRPTASDPSKVSNPDDIENAIVNCDWIDGMKRISDEAATAVIFSFPYLRAGFDYGGIFDDTMPYEDFLNFLSKGFIEIARCLRSGGLCAVVFDSLTTNVDERDEYYRHPIFADCLHRLRDTGLNYMGDLVWIKSHCPGRQVATGHVGALRIRREHEYILLFSKGPHFLDNETGAKVDLTDQERLEWTLGTSWKFGPERKHRKACGHPATFPIDIPYRLIKMFTYRHDLIVDPMVGTGTTCEAAKRLSRKYIGFDLNGDYVRYARQRLETVIAEEPDEDGPRCTTSPSLVSGV